MVDIHMPIISKASHTIRRQISLKRTLIFGAPILLSALYRYSPATFTPTLFKRMVNTSSASGFSGEGATDYGNFKLQQDFTIKYAPLRLGKWKSEKTGLTVVVGSHQGESSLPTLERHANSCSSSCKWNAALREIG